MNAYTRPTGIAQGARRAAELAIEGEDDKLGDALAVVSYALQAACGDEEAASWASKRAVDSADSDAQRDLLSRRREASETALREHAIVQHELNAQASTISELERAAVSDWREKLAGLVSALRDRNREQRRNLS